MSNQDKHTPTPWHISFADSVHAEGGKLVAVVYGDDPQSITDERQRANTAFIVRACNAYPGLISVRDCAAGLLDILEQEGFASQMVDDLRAALAKAEGA